MLFQSLLNTKMAQGNDLLIHFIFYHIPNNDRIREKYKLVRAYIVFTCSNSSQESRCQNLAGDMH